jgi:hypothetical protein
MNRFILALLCFVAGMVVGSVLQGIRDDNQPPAPTRNISVDEMSAAWSKALRDYSEGKK